MLFPHKQRFDERKRSTTVGYIAPKSELTNQGVKIVDSWVPRQSGERLPLNLTLRNGFLIPVENESPRDSKYTPHYEAILPKTTCSKWSDSPRFPEERVSISPSPVLIKLKGDFDREFKPVRGFGSAPRKLKFPTPTSAESGVTQQDRGESPIQEEPSFVSQSSLYNMDGEGSWLSVESADRSFAATSERSCSFKIGERFHHSAPLPPGPGPGAYNLRESQSFLNRSPGITLKSRTISDEYKEKRKIPGPGSYHTIPSLISPSFNVLAKSSMDHREDAFDLQNKLNQPSQSAQLSSRRPSPPSRPLSHFKQPSANKSQHHRLIFQAHDLLGTERGHQTVKSANDSSQIPGGAYRMPPYPTETRTAATAPQEMEQRQFENRISSGNSFKPVETARAEVPIHLTRDDVKHARKLFRGILETTEGMLTQQGKR